MTTAIEASRDFAIAADRLPTLYALTGEWVELVSLLEDPDADTDEIMLELQRIVGDIKAKGYGLAVVLQGIGGLAERQEAESKRLAAKAAANRAHERNLKDYALACMQSIGETRIETGTFTLSVRQNPVSARVVDASLIPSEFMRTKVEIVPDLVGIKAYAKSTGEVVPGVVLEHGSRLVVS